MQPRRPLRLALGAGPRQALAQCALPHRAPSTRCTAEPVHHVWLQDHFLLLHEMEAVRAATHHRHESRLKTIKQGGGAEPALSGSFRRPSFSSRDATGGSKEEEGRRSSQGRAASPSAAPASKAARKEANSPRDPRRSTLASPRKSPRGGSARRPRMIGMLAGPSAPSLPHLLHACSTPPPAPRPHLLHTCLAGLPEYSRRIYDGQEHETLQPSYPVLPGSPWHHQHVSVLERYIRNFSAYAEQAISPRSPNNLPWISSATPATSRV